MFSSLSENFLWLIGGGSEHLEGLSVFQVAARTVVVYLVALVIIRIAKRRFMGGYSTFDILIGIIVGSIMARTIVGAITLVNMALIVGVLVLLHGLIATISYYFENMGKVIENTDRTLIVAGEIREDALRKSKINKDDLLQALRKEANLESPEGVKAAYLERDGEITVIPKPEETRILDVKVENGVQTVRIEMESSKTK